MMARSLGAPPIGRIQKRKTNLLQIIIFGLQRAAGPYRWAISGHPRHRPSCFGTNTRAVMLPIDKGMSERRPQKNI